MTIQGISWHKYVFAIDYLFSCCAVVVIFNLKFLLVMSLGLASIPIDLFIYRLIHFI